MRDKLRKRYQVQREMGRSGCFEGEILLSETRHLGELLYSGEIERQDDKLFLRFEFVRNEYDMPMIVGRLESCLKLECQRCLKPLDWPIKLDFKLMVDASDEIVSHSSLDTIYSDEGYIDIVEVVEEELILAIPLVATHVDTACNENWKVSEVESETPASDNPFAVLKELKTTD